MRNQEKNRKKLLGLIFFFVLLLSFSVGVAIWVVINQDSEEVPGEYFPYDYEIEQEKIFTGKRLEIDNNLVAEPDSAITRIEYYFYNHDDENPLTKVEGAIYPGTYLVKVYANMTDAEGNVSEHEITNVKFDIKKRPIKITVADSDLIYGDKEDKITQSVTYSGYDDITESGFIEGDDESDLGITAENPINYSHSYEQFSNVGNYTLYATGFSSPYYEIEVINGDIDVSPYCLSYSWDEDSFKDIFYNSAGQVPTASTSATLRVQDVCNVIVNVDGEESQINQGTYKATIIGVSNSNYCISGYENDVKDFTIKPLVLKFKWDYPTGGFIYNGKDQKLEATPTNAYASDSITLNTTGTGKHANLKSDCTTKLDGVSRYKSTVESINNNELGNYALPASGLSSEFDIAPKEVTIIWTDLSFIYNGSANTPTATVVATTLIAGDSCLVNYDDGEVNANYIDDNTPIEGKQKYTILPTGLSNTDYRLSSDEASITGYYIVKQKELGITWRNDDLDSTIGKIAYTHVNASTTFHPYADINASDIVSGDSPSLVYEGEQSAANAKLSGEMQVDEETGLAKAEYTAKAKLANEKGNYKLSTDEAVITKNFIIKTAPVYPEWDQTEQVSVFAGRKMARDAITTIFSRVYNSQSQLPIAKITNAAGETLSDDLCQVIVHAQEEGFEEWIEEAINAGSYYVETIKVSNTNYELAEVIGASLTIQPKDVYITWGNLVRHYNGSYQNASVSIAADVFENDDCYVKVDTLYSKREANAYYTEAFDDPSDLFGDSYLTSLAKNDNGDYALFGEDARNYQFGPEIEGRRNEFEKEFIIKQTLLNVSALRKEITYGDYPTLELEKYISADNLQGTDTIEDLGTLNAKISYNQYDDVSAADDSYNAIWEGATNTNYHYVYHKANYFVKPKPVTITWSADTDHTYDGTYWHPSVTIAGIVNNDSLYCDFSGSEIESNAKTAREYTATVTNLNSDNDKAKNYLLTGDNYDHAFTISQRELTISWDKVSFVYNAELRFPEYTIGNVVDRDIDTLKVVEDTTDYRKNVEYAINADILETNDLNYILPLNNSTKYEITPIILELTWTGLDLTYNGSPQIITPNIFGVLEVEKDLIDVYATDKKINAGDYTATAYLSGNELGNYALPEVHAKDFEIKKVKLTVTLNNHTIIYGEEPTHNNYVLSGFVNNENDSVIDTNNLEYSYSYRQFQNIGSNYKIMATGLDAINYYFEYKDGTLKVDPKEVTISWNVASQYIYNSDYQAPTAEVTNLVNNDTCSVTVSQFVVAGDHTSQVTALGNNNYTYSVIHTQDFTILRKEVTIAWSVGTYTYNKSTQAPTYTPSGIIAGDLCSVEVTGAGINAGTYTLNAALTGSDKDNYIIKTNSTCGYIIKPKPVSVNWTVISKEYNGEAQFPTYNLVGGISGDVLGEKLSESPTNAGTYTSSINSLTNANYILDETKSTTFRITPVQLSISWGEVSFDYNGRPQKPTAEIAGLVPVDTGKVTVTVNGEQTNAGTYDATAILGGDSGMNYILPTDGEKQAFTINKLWLTVTANAHTITYGDAPTGNGVTYSGFVGEDTATVVTGTVTNYTSTYTQYGNVGSNYTITPVVTSLSATNYEFEAKAGELTVNKKPVTITWGKTELIYNGSAQAPTATVNPSDLIGTDQCTVNVTGAQTEIGSSYQATASSLSNDNYVLSGNNLTTNFSIIKELTDLVVTVINISTTYGDSFTFAVKYTINGEEVALPSGVTGTLQYTVTLNGVETNDYLNAGSYKVIASGLTDSTGVYNFIYNEGSLDVAKADLTINLATVNHTYGDTFHTGSISSCDGLVNGDTVDSLGINLTYTTSVNSSTSVSDYVVPYSANEITLDNYNVTINDGMIKVVQREVTVTWKTGPFTYTGKAINPITFGNVVNGDILTPSFVDSNGKAETLVGADDYNNITLSGLGNSNYKLPSKGITGSITVNAARIKLSITLYSEDYTSNLTWSTIQSRLKNQITFVDADNTDVTVSLNSSIYTVSGMHNGLYGYGTHGVDGLEDSPTEHIVGSTYAVIVKLVSSNYVLEGNTYFIFKYQTAKIGSKYYTIEDAIAQTGTISFAGNLANSSAPSSYVATSFCNLSRNQGSPYTSFEYTINNRKLLVPFENSTSDRSLTSTGQIANYVYSALIIPESVTLKLTGTASLVVGGKIDFAQPRTTAVCNHGVIMNYGTIDAASGTSITAYGYIKGKDSDDSSRIILRAGSTTTDCLSTYDWVGGTAASKVVSSVFPANAWSLHNISCKSYIYSGASYKGFIYTIVSGEQIYTTTDIIGKNSDSNCLFKPSASATSEDYILKDVKPASSWSVNSEEYKAMNTIIGSNQIKGQKDIIEVHGDYEDAQLKISMKITIVIPIPVNFSTSTSISAPLGYADVIVAKGSVLSLSKSDYMFMPGTTLTIDEGGVVNVANGVDLAFMSTTDILEYNDSLGGFNTHCIDKTDAKAIVNGELNVSGNIGGYIDTSAEGGVLTVSGGITANYTMLTSSGGDGKDTTVSSTKSSIGNINLIDDSNFASGSAYISTTDGTIYYWKSAENVKTFKFEFYAEDGTTLLSTKNIYVVLENANDAYSYTITGFEYTPTKLHYDFAGWLDESGKIASGTELTDASSPIKLIASWTEHEYLISYSGGYSIDGQITDVSNSMILSENAMESFFISDFVGDKLSIPTVASYTYNNLSLLFNGWFVGTDSSSGIKINSITKAQLEKFIETYGINSPIPLYCEFTNDKFFNVIINDSNGKSILDGQNALGFMVKENNSIMGSGYTISVNSDSIDNNPDEQYYFNGFKDSQGNVYSLDELVNLKISSDMNLTVNWSQKSKVIYKDHEGNVIGNPLWVLSGTTISLALSQSRDAVSGDKYNTQYSFAGWKDSVTNTIIAGGSSYTVNSNEITFTAEYTPTYIYILTVDVDNSTITVNGTAYTADAEIIYYVNSTSQTVSVSFTATGNSTKYLKVTWDGDELYANSNKDYSGTQTLSKHTVLGAIGSDDRNVCFAEGTLITLADGSKKAIENLENTDMLLVFNHITGKHDVAPATFLIHKGAEKSYHRVINLKFSDDTILRIIGYHGLYSKTANDYVYISENNIDNYLGHEFYTEKGKTIKLNDYHITNEYINVYSPISSYHLNCFAEGILTVSNFTEFMMNMFEYEEDMTYNEAEIQLEIAKYGLTTYDDFKDYVSYEVYCMFPAQYMNIAIGKGLITKEEIIELINEYLIPYQLK